MNGKFYYQRILRLSAANFQFNKFFLKDFLEKTLGQNTIYINCRAAKKNQQFFQVWILN